MDLTKIAARVSVVRGDHGPETFAENRKIIEDGLEAVQKAYDEQNWDEMMKQVKLLQETFKDIKFDMIWMLPENDKYGPKV